MILRKNMKNKIVIKKIIFLVKKALKKGPKGLHDPLFIGNEKKYLTDCITTGYVSSVGKYVKMFEKKISNFTKAKYAVATVTGTSALHLVLKFYNLTSKDEVLIPSLTYIATATAVKYCDAYPNFVDVESDTLGIDPEKLEKYLERTCKKVDAKTYNKKTGRRIKALIVVHLYGFPGKLFRIKKICKKYNIILIEDAAEALGSFYKNKHVGTFGEVGILSFNGNKPITCGGGGMIITNNKKMAAKLKHLSVHAKKKYPNDHVHDEIGYNYRMTNLSAAVGCAQLEKVNIILKAKRDNHKLYSKIFKKNDQIKILDEPKFSRTNYWLIIANLKNIKLKKQLMNELKKKGFISRSLWRPLHTLKIFQDCPRDKLKNTLNIFNSSINLPSSPGISYKKK